MNIFFEYYTSDSNTEITTTQLNNFFVENIYIPHLFILYNVSNLSLKNNKKLELEINPEDITNKMEIKTLNNILLDGLSNFIIIKNISTKLTNEIYGYNNILFGPFNTILFFTSDVTTKLFFEIKTNSTKSTQQHDVIIQNFLKYQNNVVYFDNLSGSTLINIINITNNDPIEIIIIDNCNLTENCVIMASKPVGIIVINSNVKINFIYNPLKTECPKLDCPKTVCSKTECPKLECPKLECPKLECPKLECPKLECPNNTNNIVYSGMTIIGLALIIFFLYKFANKKKYKK